MKSINKKSDGLKQRILSLTDQLLDAEHRNTVSQRKKSKNRFDDQYQSSSSFGIKSNFLGKKAEWKKCLDFARINCKEHQFNLDTSLHPDLVLKINNTVSQKTKVEDLNSDNKSKLSLLTISSPVANKIDALKFKEDLDKEKTSKLSLQLKPLVNTEIDTKISIASSPSAAAIPPMSFKAPSKPSDTVTSTTSSTTSTTAAIPPMSFKAPSKPSDTVTSSTASTASTTAAIPPMSFKAPSKPTKTGFSDQHKSEITQTNGSFISNSLSLASFNPLFNPPKDSNSAIQINSSEPKDFIPSESFSTTKPGSYNIQFIHLYHVDQAIIKITRIF